MHCVHIILNFLEDGRKIVSIVTFNVNIKNIYNLLCFFGEKFSFPFILIFAFLFSWELIYITFSSYFQYLTFTRGIYETMWSIQIHNFVKLNCLIHFNLSLSLRHNHFTKQLPTDISQHCRNSLLPLLFSASDIKMAAPR